MSTLRQKLPDFLRDRNLTMAEASRAMGRNHAYLQQFMERGVPRELPEKARKELARVLGRSEAELRDVQRSEVDALDAPPPTVERMTSPQPNARVLTTGQLPRLSFERDLPIMGRAQGGADGVLLVDGEAAPIDWTYRPPELMGVRDAYGAYVDGDSMKSAGLPHGATVLVHPSRRPAPESFVVLTTIDGLVFIKRYKKIAAGMIVLEQTDPQKQFKFNQEKVRTMHLVVGVWYRW